MSIIVQTHQYRTDNRIYVGSEGKEPLTVHEYDMHGEEISCKSYSNMNFAQFISTLARNPVISPDVKKGVLAEVNSLISRIEPNIPLSVPDSLTCSVCAKPWDETVEMFPLCGHSFHAECIQFDVCPDCREDVTKGVPNYALRNAMGEISIDKAPIPLLSAANGSIHIQVALQHIETAKKYVAKGEEEEALKEFKLAFTYTNRSEDYQELSKALETFAKAAMAKNSVIFKMATQKAQLAYLYLTKYQLDENKIEKALESLSRCALIDADLQAVLQAGQLFEERVILAPFFSKADNLDEIKDIAQPLREIKTALLTLPFIEKGKNLINTLQQLSQIGDNLPHFNFLFTVCQFVEQLVELELLQDKKLTKKHLEEYNTTVKEITSHLDLISQKMQGDEKVIKQCEEVKTVVQKGFDIFSEWVMTDGKHPSFDHFEDVRATLNEMLYLFDHKRVSDNSIYSRGTPSGIKEVGVNEAAAFQLLEQLDEIHDEITAIKAISDMSLNETRRKKIAENIGKMQANIEGIQKEESSLVSALHTAEDAIFVRQKSVDAIRRIARFFSKEGSLIWELLSPLVQLYQASESLQVESKLFLSYAASLSHFDPPKAMEFYSALLHCDPQHWSAYAPFAALHTDPLEQTHILLQGACSAIQAKEYEEAKELCDKALALHKPLIPTEKVEIFDSYLNELVFLELYSAMDNREELDKQLTLYGERCCTPTFFQNRVAKMEENNPELSIKVQLIEERIQINKMLVRLNAESVQAYRAIRDAHQEMHAIDPSHPLEKVVRWSLSYLEKLVQQEKWEEAAPVAKELLSLWEQVEDSVFLKKNGSRFSTLLATYLQKQGAKKAALLQKSTVTILEQLSSLNNAKNAEVIANQQKQKELASSLQESDKKWEQLNTKLDAATQENETLKKLLEEEKTKYEVFGKNKKEHRHSKKMNYFATIKNLQDKLSAANSAKAEAEKRFGEKSSELQESNKQNEKLRSEVQNLTKSLENSNKQKDTRAQENETLKKELEAKNEKLKKQKESELQSLTDLEKKVAVAQSVQAQWQEKFNTNSLQLQESNKQNEKLRSEVQNLTKSLENSNKQKDTRAQENETLKKELEAKNEKLKKQKESELQSLTVLEKKVAVAQSVQAQWQEKFNANSLQLQKSNEQNEELRSQLSTHLRLLTRYVTVGYEENHIARRFNFEGASLDDEAMRNLCECIKENGEISELNLAHNKLGDLSIQYLTAVLRNHSYLRSVNLAGNEITDIGAAKLIKFFAKKVAGGKPFYLSLSTNRITDLIIPKLTKIMSYSNVDIRLTMNLIGNQISEEQRNKLPKKGVYGMIQIEI